MTAKRFPPSRVPMFTFAATLEGQERQLAANQSGAARPTFVRTMPGHALKALAAISVKAGG